MGNEDRRVNKEVETSETMKEDKTLRDPTKCNTKQSDGGLPLMLELWGMQSTFSLPSLPGPLWPGVVASDRVLSMGQIELNCVLMLN